MKSRKFVTITFWVVSLSSLAGIAFMWISFLSRPHYRASPKAVCVLNMRNTQQAVRSYQRANDHSNDANVSFEDLKDAGRWLWNCFPSFRRARKGCERWICVARGGAACGVDGGVDGGAVQPVGFKQEPDAGGMERGRGAVEAQA